MEGSFHYTKNNSFSTTLPYLQISWDSTSLGELKTCPRKYFYSIICGYQSYNQSIHLTFGLLYHSTLEYYDHMKFSGMDHETALEATVLKVLTDTWDKKLNRPIEMDSDSKSRLGLLRTIVWYLDQFKDDPLKTVKLENGKPAIELSFRLETEYTSITNQRYLLCGHLDKVAELEGKTYIVDRKTTGKTMNEAYFERFTPDNQFSLYNFAGGIIYSHNMSGLIVDAAQVAVTFSRFQRKQIFRPPSVVSEWYKDFGIILKQAEMYAENEYWPMNDKACLTGDTEVSMRRGKNKKKITIYDLWRQSQGIDIGHRYNWELHTQLLSDVGGHVAFQRMYRVIKVGVKPIFELETNLGKKLRATADHEIKSENNWKRLDQLQIGDKIHTWRFSKTNNNNKNLKNTNNRSEISNIPYHPLAIRKKDGTTCKRKSILTCEASLNNLSLLDYIIILRFFPNKIQGLKFIEKGYEVHHKDGDHTNDNPSNLEVLTEYEHHKKHEEQAIIAMNKIELEIIRNISYIGEEEVYDISMEGPHHNFIANGIVVHNCGVPSVDPKTNEITWGCQYRQICSKPQSLRPQFLNASFGRRTWDPMIARGDI